MVAASSTSEGWNIVDCSSGSSTALGRHQLADVDAVERPAVRRGHAAELLRGLGQRDVEHRLSAFAPPDSRNCRASVVLPGAGNALDEIEAAPLQAAAEHVVQPFDSGAYDLVDAIRHPSLLSDVDASPAPGSAHRDGIMGDAAVAEEPPEQGTNGRGGCAAIRRPRARGRSRGRGPIVRPVARSPSARAACSRRPAPCSAPRAARSGRAS